MITNVFVKFPQDNWSTSLVLNYAYSSDFFQPTESITVSLISDDIPDLVKKTIHPRDIELWINGYKQFAGYITDHSISDVGIVTISAVSYLAKLETAYLDGITIKTGEKISQALDRTLFRLGFESEAGGDYRFVKEMKTGESFSSFRADLNQVVSDNKSQPSEFAIEFIKRIIKRYGIVIKEGTLKNKIIFAKPNITANSTYSLVRTIANNDNNILAGVVKRNYKELPSVVVARGNTFTSEETTTRLEKIYNPFDILAGNKEIIELQKYYQSGYITPTQQTPPVGLYLPLVYKDTESRNQKELENKMVRETMNRVAPTLVCEYQISGHKINDKMVCVDSIVDVKDEIGQVQENMWVSAINMTGDQSGASTDITLYRPDTITVQTG